MKILIFSDSHGNTENLNKMLAEHEFDYLFFLGDGISDLGTLTQLNNIKYVKGNCDFFSQAPYEEVIELEGVRFLLVHGHNEGVKSGLGGLLKRAKEVGAHVACFGHTHQFLLETYNNITLLNPGSISLTRGGKQTFVVANVSNKKTTFQFIQF